MNNKVFVSCAVTGSGDTASKHPDLPKTPEQIAKAAIEAAKAGAAIAHIHVREDDGAPSRRLELYKEVVDRVRSSETDVILNLTTGMGGDIDIGHTTNAVEAIIIIEIVRFPSFGKNPDAAMLEIVQAFGLTI